MSPSGSLMLWVGLWYCSSSPLTAGAEDTVSFFKTCGNTLLLADKESYNLHLDGSEFTAGQESCRVSVDGDGMVEVRCDPEQGSSVGDGVQLRVETRGPPLWYTYNSKHWISEEDGKGWAALYILKVNRDDPYIPPKLNLTFHIKGKRFHSASPKWIWFLSSLPLVVLVGLLVLCRARKRSTNGEMLPRGLTSKNEVGGATRETMISSTEVKGEADEKLMPAP